MVSTESGIEVFGIPAPYTERGPDRETRDLPKAYLSLEIPTAENSGGEDVLELLRRTHSVKRFGSWDEFVAPYLTGAPFGEPANPRLLVFRNFILADVNKSMSSRSQIVETNEDPVLFMFGKRARVYSYQFHILSGGRNLAGQNTDQLRYFEDFYERFDGTAIATYGLRLTLHFDREEHEVVWMDMNIRRSSEIDVLATATSQMYLVNRRRKSYTIGKKG